MKLLGFFAWIAAAMIAIYYGGLFMTEEFKKKVREYSFEFYLAHTVIWSTVVATIVILIYLTVKTIIKP